MYRSGLGKKYVFRFWCIYVSKFCSTERTASDDRGVSMIHANVNGKCPLVLPDFEKKLEFCKD